MFKILHVQGSPRTGLSASAQVARAFIDSYRAVHPGAGEETLSVFEADLPPFAAPAAAAKYAVLEGVEPRDEAELAWQPVVDAIRHFTSADLYVISSPMWNFGIPYRLKQYVDILVQPGMTFSYSPSEGYKGLVTGRSAVLALARGGEYPEGHAYDLQRPYLETILRYIGFTDIRAIMAEGQLGPGGAGSLRAAIEQARELGRSL